MKKLFIITIIILSFTSCRTWDCIFDRYDQSIPIDSSIVEVPIYVPIPIDTASIIGDSVQVYARSLSSLRAIIDSLLAQEGQDSIFVEKVINLPARVKDDSISAETNVAKAVARINNNKLSLTITNKQDSLLHYYNYYKVNVNKVIKERNDILGKYNQLKDKVWQWWMKLAVVLASMFVGFIIASFIRR